MKRENLLARLLRALSGKSQDRTAQELGVHPTLVSQIETGQSPTRDYLERLAQTAEITLAQGWEILSRYEAFVRSRRKGRSTEILLQDLASEVHSKVAATYQRLLSLPLPVFHPAASDRLRGEELWSRLADLSEEARLAVVQVAEEYQNWALCERVCRESVEQVSRHLERAAGLARLAQEVAERVTGPKEWRNYLRGYSAAHAANVLRVSGDLKVSDATFEEALCLWRAGADPGAVLDPGRLLDLEASLRRDQRRFEDALSLLDRATAVGHSPARSLIKKGFTLEVMGDYERAVETLLQAAPLIEVENDPRLLYMLRFNLAVNFCHTGRFDEANRLVAAVHKLASDRGDENEIPRVLWLEGRIAAGLGRSEEALNLLHQARQGFSNRKMVTDAALVLLEESVLLLEEGRTAQVKELARGLAEVLESKGIHREALAALLLFQEAAESETATVDLTRRLLGFLYRARHDPGLRFAL
ncbi:MAG TPA: helix-turn-helix transcriptional regulator [Thermoanaerobaculia bacterium]|nr:helix-turn-helix transcriptional regulator [Thermoanaerobaculia bacterium]